MNSTAPVFELAERLYLDESQKEREVLSDEHVPVEVGENLTDLGNAKRFVRLHGENVSYCVQWNCWLVWDGARWGKDDAMRIDRMAESVALNLDRESSETDDKERRQALRKAAQAAESNKRKKDMLDMTRQMVAVRQDDLDKNPWLLTTRNMVIDLEELTIREPRRKDLITKRADVEYKPEAQCPRWREFLQMVMDGNEDLVIFLQKAAGYSLTGCFDERCFFILYGNGRNGKSTFVETIASILDDYATRTPTETLLAKRYDGIPNDIAALKGARFVHAAESKEGRGLSEALVKHLTGGDTISARFMRGEWFTFRPEFKLWLSTNHKPVIKETSDAMWDRIRLIPFNVRIPDDKLIPASEVAKRFAEEKSGILNWMLEGFAMWRAEGLVMPDSVKRATNDYRSEMDVFAEFIDDCCVIEKTAEVTVKALYESFTRWCEQNHEKAIKKRTLGARLLEKGFGQHQEKTGDRARTWSGIGLRA